MDIDEFMNYFILSGVAEQWEKGYPKFVCGMSGTELHHHVMYVMGDDSEWPDPVEDYYTGDDYWVGWILAYFQWYTGYSYKKIFAQISCKDLFRMYPAMHTASEDRAVDALLQMTSASKRLQAYRKRLGMSQRDLSVKSGVNIRTLQQYEIGAKDLNRAAVQTVLALSKTLAVTPEELID